MRRPKQTKLADALEKLQNFQASGSHFAIRGIDILGAESTRILLENGFLEQVIKGWYIPSTPSHAGTTVTWYASFWGFIADYCNYRFGDDWSLTPEESLLFLSGADIIPQQVLIRAKNGSNTVQTLIHGTSILNISASLPVSMHIDPVHSLRTYSLEEALLRCSPAFFINHRNEAIACINAVESNDQMLNIIETAGGEADVGRLIGAFAATGRKDIAETITQLQKKLGRRLVVNNPFESELDTIVLPESSPIASRIRIMWKEMRESVINLLPAVDSSKRRSFDDILKDIDEGYVADSYHSLSIEGYRVSEDLIRRVRDGQWDPAASLTDGETRNALAASGYYRAYQKVRASIIRILNGENAGQVVASDSLSWHRELFMPSVDAGILTAADLGSYRSGQVYIAGSRYIPPSAEKFQDAMTVYFDLLRTEPDYRVQAILGHFFFVHIHPFQDGNGRTARFIMNAFLTAGGCKWAVIPLSQRKRYMECLELASVESRIDDFVTFILKSAVGLLELAV